MRSCSLFVALLLVASLLFPATSRAEWPSGQTFTDGATLDVTPEGFDALSDAIPTLVPSYISLPTDTYGYNVYEADYGTCCDPIFGWICWTCWEYVFAIWNGWASIQLDDVTLQPEDGFLALSANATIALNRSWDPMKVYGYVEAGINDLGISLSIDQQCDAWTDAIAVGLSASVYLEVRTGPDGRYLDVTIPRMNWDTDLGGDDLHLDDCFLGELIDFIQGVGGVFGFDPIGEIIGLLEDQIDAQIQSLIPDIEGLIEDAFAQARVEESVDIAGTVLDIALQPYDIQVTPSGARLAMSGSFAAEPHPCVADYGITGSLETAGTLQPIGVAPAGVTAPHHIGAMVSDDFVNSGLFAAWNAGLLCYDLQETETLPINTALLTLLSRDAYGELFPSAAPMIISTSPHLPPEAFPTGSHDFNVEIRDLGLDIYAELDYRMARILGNELEADAGLDFDFDTTTGELTIDVTFDADDIRNAITYNEIAPAYTDQLEDAFGSLLETLLTPLLGDLLTDITFPVPSFVGFGVQDLEYAATGPQEDFFGLFGLVG
ncbi:MAG: hypothetical protein JRI25_07320, partial [Deltaproteobacteria bacterium]|nr:hypothetical protein [Deltaproteobacteria bacterium]